MQKLKTWVVSVLLLGTINGFAKTVYLSSTGNDSNDGLTAATAVASLSKAMDGIAAGDIVYVSGIINVDSETVIGNIGGQGITFIGNNRDEDGFSGQQKTRIFNVSACTMKFYNLTFERGLFSGNPGGGAYMQQNGSAYFENCLLKNNNTDYVNEANGGAIRTQNVELKMLNCELYGNYAFRGGAIEARGGKVILTNTQFLYNGTLTSDRKTNGGAAGGALSLIDINTTEITHCTIDNNVATGNGGAFNIAGNGVVNFKIIGSAITNNKAGGKEGQFDLEAEGAGKVYNNGRARGAHGGMMIIGLTNRSATRYLIAGTTIAKNSCTAAGGIVLFNGVGTAGQEFNIVNCTLTGNETEDNVGNSGGINMQSKSTTLNIVNTILEGNWSNGNKRYSDGWWKETPVNIVNSYVGYIYQCNGEGGQNYETGYTMTNSHWFTTPAGNSTMASGISTEADCTGNCYPLYPGSEATTMGDVSLAETYGATVDQKGNKLTKPYIGAVQYVLGDVIKDNTEVHTAIDRVMDDYGMNGSATTDVECNYSVYTLDGKAISTAKSMPDLSGLNGTVIVVKRQNGVTLSKKIINL